MWTFPEYVIEEFAFVDDKEIVVSNVAPTILFIFELDVLALTLLWYVLLLYIHLIVL